jgi:hypothetical protein
MTKKERDTQSQIRKLAHQAANYLMDKDSPDRGLTMATNVVEANDTMEVELVEAVESVLREALKDIKLSNDLRANIQSRKDFGDWCVLVAP